MKIIEVKENKKQYLDLLLLADKQEDIEGIFVSDEMTCYYEADSINVHISC